MATLEEVARMNDTQTARRDKTPRARAYNVPDEQHVPPHSHSNEEAAISSAIGHDDWFDAVNRVVQTADAFYVVSHRLIWRVMQCLRMNGSPIDAVTIRDELQSRGQVEDAGGVTKLLELFNVPPNPVHGPHYAKLVRRDYDKRRAIETLQESLSDARSPECDPTELLTRVTEQLQSLGDGGRSGRTFKGVDSNALSAFASMEPDWLVDGVFTSDEPLLVGARSKGCKTLQLTDLAVSLATGTPWMGIFEVPKQRRVLFISGETNYRRMSKHIENACRVRGGTFDDLGDLLRVETVEFPNLPSVNDLQAIHRTIEQHGIEVVIVDPLYRGMAGVDASQLSEMGSIKSFQAACQPACVILSHHAIKAAARDYGTPPALEDLAGAGVAESCGQWWLVGRNEAYAYDGKHDLCVSYGGREGQAGGLRILFDDRAWTFDVEHLSDFIDQAKEERRKQLEANKRDAEDRKLNQARNKIILACRNEKSPQAESRIRTGSGQSGQTFTQAFASLVQDQTILPRPYRDACNRPHPEGYILAEYAPEYDQKWSAE